MKLMSFEARHNDGGGYAKGDHEGTKRGAEPAEGAMHADIVRAHECGLQDEEEHPGRESRSVNPENGGTRHVCFEEVRVDRTAEAPDDKCYRQQRHCKVKVLVDEAIPAGDGMRRSYGDGLRR